MAAVAATAAFPPADGANDNDDVNDAEEKEDYYEYFNRKTNNGVVFDENLCALGSLPDKELTRVEKQARKKWLWLRKKIRRNYEGRDPDINSIQDLLDQRILAPCLTTAAVSTRSKPAEPRAGRRYPRSISAWSSFAQDVANFQPNEKPVVRIWPFSMSAMYGDPEVEIRDERQEEIFLVNLLNLSLGKQKLIGRVVSSGPVVGQPDVMIVNVGNADGKGDKREDDKEDGGEEDDDSEEYREEDDDSEDSYAVEDVEVLCEFKSTHNLALPMSAIEVCHTYNTAYSEVYEARIGRTDGWSRKCHPIGQLLGYMADNSKRYGILSSGTRSYFLRITKDEVQDIEVVEISDAMFVGQANYLKAWVYIHQLDGGGKIDVRSLPWKTTSKRWGTPPAKGKRKQPPRGTGGGGSGSPPSKVARIEHSVPSGSGGGPGASANLNLLPSVPFSEIKIIKALGSGRNGTVFLADWNGKNVALKQFDIDKSGLAFDREVEAYMTVREAWGRLVPIPFFLSESWSGGTRFLALQVGRSPKSGDDVSNWNEIVTTLENEFGLRHEDSDRRNMLFIPHGDHERLVAVDLEDVTMILPPRNPVLSSF